jgi:hypothetical protein
MARPASRPSATSRSVSVSVTTYDATRRTVALASMAVRSTRGAWTATAARRVYAMASAPTSKRTARIAARAAPSARWERAAAGVPVSAPGSQASRAEPSASMWRSTPIIAVAAGTSVDRTRPAALEHANHARPGAGRDASASTSTPRTAGPAVTFVRTAPTARWASASVVAQGPTSWPARVAASIRGTTLAIAEHADAPARRANHVLVVAASCRSPTTAAAPAPNWRSTLRTAARAACGVRAGSPASQAAASDRAPRSATRRV